MDNLTQTKCQVIFNFYFDSNPFFSCPISTVSCSALFYSIFLLFCRHNMNVLTEKCSLVWQSMPIILPVCGNHTWKKCSASGSTHLCYAWGEPDLSSESHGEASEIKSEGKDMTEILLMMRQKLIFSVGMVALMWFQNLTTDESGLESSWNMIFMISA